LLLLFDGITALDHWAAERDPIEEVVIAFDFCGLDADGTTDIHAGDEAQQEQRALDAAEFAERTVQSTTAVVRTKHSQQHRWHDNAGLDRQHDLDHVGRMPPMGMTPIPERSEPSSANMCGIERADISTTDLSRTIAASRIDVDRCFD
jgi:hypothetical protein